MLLKKENIKQYITFGNEIEAYVYRRDNNIIFMAHINDKNLYHSNLTLSGVLECRYFVHKNLEEVEKFLNDLLLIEKIVIDKGFKFPSFISNYWNVITDHLLFNWDDNDMTLDEYINHLLIKWSKKLDSYKEDFDKLVEKKRTNFELYSLWDDDKLYEIAKKCSFEIPEDVKKSKNDILLSGMLDSTKDILKILKDINSEEGNK